ncbi:MAG: Flp pilus assembly complex ATPase component TadA [Alphaproteobacteria bacterium]|nr:Flp pilus assembly complex ATPase component TadA [Alphaproteobacteria bacterium]
MADNETPPSVPEVTEQTSQQATDTMPAGEDVLDSESEKMPENMASPEEILGPQAPLSEVLTSLKDYPAEGKKQDEQPAEPTATPTQSAPEQTAPAAAEPVVEQEEPNPDNPISADSPDYSSISFLKELYSNGNECITLASGAFPVSEETRSLLALFSNGRFFVVEQYKYDGRVLGFEYLAKKRRLQLGEPEYVSQTVLRDIYEYAVQIRVAPQTITDEENQEQTRMQRDFVTVISRAAMNQVSDIHIVVADHTTVMFRVNGLMQTEMEYNKEWGESFVRAAFASSDISDSNYAQNEYQAAQKLGRTPLRGSGGRLVLPKNILGIRLQFNPIAFGTRYVVMRLLYADESTANPETALLDLGFTKQDTDMFYQLRAVPTGIVIVSGPTGSGKSTTLQRNMIAMLQERNYETNLITVEDPPEYPIPGARQMPVTNAGIEEAKDREFTKALSAALRSDPDSLMIGEIRTLSAADLAFRGALSGHNVWTTLHANTASAILLRLKDMGVEDFKLQDPTIMRGMLAQRLFRKLCPSCRIPAKDHLDHPAVQRLRNAFGDVGLEHAYLRGQGCAACNFRGVSGRTAVAEFILPDSTFLNLTLKGETQKAQNYWINDLGGRTLRENALSRMFHGLIDIEEVERWTGFLDQINLT